MDKIKISVALCTYNGATYIEEQLTSILSQTHLPDELIIGDDGSTDGTLELVRKFAQKCPFKVVIVENNTQKPFKVTKNFERVLAACSGNYIFLCDQDDVWLPQKIERLSAVLDTNPTTEMVFSDAELVSETLTPLNRTQWQVVRFGEPQRTLWKNGKAIDVMLGGNRVTGCTVALRRTLLEASMPFPTHIPEVIHDNWLAWVATVRHSIVFYDECLTLYRQHEKQQIGARPKEQPTAVGWKERFSRPREEKLAPIKKEYDTLKTLYEALIITQKDIKNVSIEQKLTFLKLRLELNKYRFLRLKSTFTCLFKGMYHKYKDQEANSKAPYLTFFGDLLE